jgi:hypothetical protein
MGIGTWWKCAREKTRGSVYDTMVLVQNFEIGPQLSNPSNAGMSSLGLFI